MSCNDPQAGRSRPLSYTPTHVAWVRKKRLFGEEHCLIPFSGSECIQKPPYVFGPFWRLHQSVERITLCIHWGGWNRLNAGIDSRSTRTYLRKMGTPDLYLCLFESCPTMSHVSATTQLRLVRSALGSTPVPVVSDELVDGFQDSHGTGRWERRRNQELFCNGLYIYVYIYIFIEKTHLICVYAYIRCCIYRKRDTPLLFGACWGYNQPPK